MNMPYFDYPYSCKWIFQLFLVLVIINKTIMSILVHVAFVEIYFPFLGCVLKVSLIFTVGHHAYGIKTFKNAKDKRDLQK